MDGNIFYGWFDDADQVSPSYEPQRDARCRANFCQLAPIFPREREGLLLRAQISSVANADGFGNLPSLRGAHVAMLGTWRALSRFCSGHLLKEREAQRALQEFRVRQFEEEWFHEACSKSYRVTSSGIPQIPVKPNDCRNL